MIRSGRTTRLVVAFGAGCAGLELSGTLLHGLVLRDLPREVTVGSVVAHDLTIALFGAVLFGLGLSLQGAGSLRRAARGDLVLALVLGLLFALVLELINNALPGSLFQPASRAQATLAWAYFVSAPLLASVPVGRRLRAAAIAAD